MRPRGIFAAILCSSIILLVNCEGQLPQFVNADGSLSSGGQSAASNVFNGATNAIENAGQQLGQLPQSVANGAENAYQHGQQYLQQGVDGMKNAANQFGNRLEQFGNELAEGPRNFLNNVGQMGTQFQNGIDQALRSGVDKLKELQNAIGEKFRPLMDKAVEIFGKPGTEKEHWNELVSNVESTNLSQQEKQEVYQKIANATAPQVNSNQIPQQLQGRRKRRI
ncbi:unnamed protein product [Bursaphelenchus xylophilus]|uniref:(pine wood nematode) hypothetical protein n=1 Tax=Bursaphelenchus xylophilus TaxID=6326 RepID=A0A1I7SEE4_BURXY|nr:unnamed protein product [Bursaphelenchus xylophilus]CAG9104046.1 unnamed protein product [Bursaphelenchus xylophilus]